MKNPILIACVILSICVLVAGYYLHTRSTVETSPCLTEHAHPKVKFDPTDKGYAYFAGGCFWTMESEFQKLDTVGEVVSGYAGGTVKSPSYEDVITETTGHKETVKVIYDAQKVTYRDLVHHFLRHIDPTDGGGQFYDRGESYQPTIFYETAEQKQIAEDALKELTAAQIFTKPLVVAIVPLNGDFYPAEAYHQDYADHNPDHYCSYRAASGRDAYLQSVWGERKWVNEKSQIPNSKFQNTMDAITPKPSDAELRKKLTSLQYDVTQHEGTEPPYHNEYWDNHESGIYVDIVSGEVLFSSRDKYDSGTGWPSFTKLLVAANIKTRTDYSLGLPRTEVRSAHADSHLGHLFDDGPADRGGNRYCMNSAAMRFIPKAQMASAGYGQYLSSL